MSSIPSPTLDNIASSSTSSMQSVGASSSGAAISTETGPTSQGMTSILHGDEGLVDPDSKRSSVIAPDAKDENEPPSPSSAPPTPRVTGTTHPPPFIHTHHPRRTSLIPLGLNVISPVSPFAAPSPLPSPPIRTYGFSPNQSLSDPNLPGPSTAGPSSYAYDYEDFRRGSTTSSNSTLTQTRPHGIASSNPFAGHSAFPTGHSPFPLQSVGGMRDRRKSANPPGNLSLAPVDPTRRTKGRNSRPTTSDGTPQRPQLRSNPTEGSPLQPLRLLNGSRLMPDYARRGSLPQLSYGDWSGTSYHRHAAPWQPSLTPQRGSVDEAQTVKPADAPRLSPALPAEGYKFGSINPNATSDSPAVNALKSIDLSPNSRRGSWLSYTPSTSAKLKENMDVFEQAEAIEAEKQRKAFFSATYGEDGKKARQRLSIGGGSNNGAGRSPPGEHLRRQSLVLWEKMHAATRLTETQSDMGPTTLDPLFPGPIMGLQGDTGLGDLGPRRGSLPVDIPVVEPNRRTSVVQVDPGLGLHATAEAEADDDLPDPTDPANMSRRDTLRAPLRPLPPLLPLSDPGPRLLPSTLALHRASHLLSSRNLQAEPLPHPLPPSLHPPAPVDLAEFDIDFILAGSSAQLGGSSDKPNVDVPVDIVGMNKSAVRSGPQFQLGPDEGEDSFAKFVGAFDDEYGGRRGAWTFRPSSKNATSLELTRAEDEQDPLDAGPKSEWTSRGAGKYELYSNGEVRSVQTGSVWRIERTNPKTYHMVKLTLASGESADIASEMGYRATGSDRLADRYVLTTKKAHSASRNGVKIPSIDEIGSSDVGSGMVPPTEVFGSSPGGSGLFGQPSNLGPGARGARIGSSDSVTPKTGFASLPQSLPIPNFASPKKKKPAASPNTPSDQTLPQHPGLRSRASDAFATAKVIRSLDDTVGTKSMSRSKSDERNKQLANRSQRAQPALPGAEKEEESKKPSGKSLGGKLKRAFMMGSGGPSHEQKKAQREEKEREKQQSASWSPSISRTRDRTHPHGHGHSHSATHSIESTTGRTGARAVSHQSPLVPLSGVSPGIIEPSSELGTSPDTQSTMSSKPSPLLEMEDGYFSGVNTLRQSQGKAWECVPEEALAMVIPIDLDESSMQLKNTISSSSISHSSSLGTPRRKSKAHIHAKSPDRGLLTKVDPTQALLVWYVPFNFDQIAPWDESRPTTSSSSVSSNSGLHTDNTDSRTKDREIKFEASSFGSKGSQGSSHGHLSSNTGGQAGVVSGSLPKFQKLLRRRTSREKDGMRKEHHPYAPPVAEPALSGTDDKGSGSAAISLPFKSFRVVARVVSIEDLTNQKTPMASAASGAVARPKLVHAHSSPSSMKERNQDDPVEVLSSPNQFAKSPPVNLLSISQTELPGIQDPRDNLVEPSSAIPAVGVILDQNAIGSSATSVSTSPNLPDLEPISTKPTSTTVKPVNPPSAASAHVPEGRDFPTVIAVCHGRSSGVEFVLEGLDRLGLCKGESAWGPTGYEEWRGAGLSDLGREVVDVLWVGCVGIMGLVGK